MSKNSTEFKPVKRRSELVFLYDAVDTNPNGDPISEDNKPRIDQSTNQAIVTAVRIKRVIRDYLERAGHDIFITKVEKDGIRHSKADRYETIMEIAQPLLEEGYSKRDAFLEIATDTRLFGDTMASSAFDFEASSIVGPVQFGIARSMNEVDLQRHHTTSVLAPEGGKSTKRGGSVFTDLRIAYALMRVHGVIDHLRARDSRMRQSDVDLVLEGLWTGTKELTHTTSKHGHEPRLLIKVTYNDGHYLGDLHKEISLEVAEQVEDETAIRDIAECRLDLSDLIETLHANESAIHSIAVRAHRRLKVKIRNNIGGADIIETTLEDEFEEIPFEIRYG